MRTLEGNRCQEEFVEEGAVRCRGAVSEQLSHLMKELRRLVISQFDGVERVVAVYVAAEDRSAGSAAV
jgi:hypothetical protein